MATKTKNVSILNHCVFDLSRLGKKCVQLCQMEDLIDFAEYYGFFL